MAKQHLRRAATREHILAAADKLFASKGIEATTIDDIVAAADIARGTFYYNFASKEAVVIGISRQAFAKLYNSLTKRLEAEESPSVLLRELLIASCRWIARHKHLAEVLLLAPLKNPRAVVQETPADQPSFRRLALAILQRGQACGEIRSDIDSAVLMQIATGLYLQAAILWIQVGRGKLETWIDQFLKVYLEGARAPRAES
jgi:AcrR family transcriptional regulator